MKEWIIAVPEDGRIINSTPVKELVRCKDCILYNQEAGVCSKGHAHGYAVTWFCADGEKEE